MDQSNAILMQEATILMRLATLETDMKDVKRTLLEVRDHQLLHPSCPRPGLCLELLRVIEGHAGAIKRLENMEVRIVTVCAIIAFFVPLLMAWLHAK